MFAKLKETKKQFETLTNKWNELFQNEEEQNKELLKALEIDGLEQTETKLNKLRKKEESLLNLKRKLEDELKVEHNRLIIERENLLSKLQSTRNNIYKIREQKANEITKKLQNNIRVRIHKSHNREQYINLLIDMLRGSRIRIDAIKSLAQKVHPIKLTKLIMGKKHKELSDLSGLDENITARIVDYMLSAHTYRDLYDLQVQELEDLVEIQFKFSDQNYKSITKLSHGQKCMVILNIALVEGEFPMLVDQPEDALDSQYIFDYVVTTLRDKKDLRQFILTTHNANILVSTDTEQAFVLKATANEGKIESSGSIDRFTTRDLVLLNLEGGEYAFDLRRKKYGLLKLIPRKYEEVPEVAAALDQ